MERYNVKAINRFTGKVLKNIKAHSVPEAQSAKKFMYRLYANIKEFVDVVVITS